MYPEIAPIKEETRERATKVANYIVENKCTYKEAAEVFGLSKRTVGYYTSTYHEIDFDTYIELKDIANANRMANLSKVKRV